jgi:dTMP kinase
VKGKLIVIEGTDGSGKATQAKLLVEALTKKGNSVELVDFPQYGKPSAAMVEEYLNGKLGTADEVGPYRASIFYAVDRYAKSHEMKKWLSEGRIIICNRYITANKGHQAGKLPSEKEVDSYLKWIDELEFNVFGIPKPDKVIFLHMPPEVGQKLVDKKGARQYVGGNKRDIHEADIEHLKNAEKAYLYVAKKEKWDIIECSDGKEPLTIETIHKRILEKVSKAL